MSDEIKNYSNIEIPYDDYLSRGNITNPEGSLDSSNGSVEEQIKTGDSFNDLWIRNFIKSNDWSPKKKGFYLDGRKGYAEFMDVFISGNIQALTGIIGGFTINATSLTSTSGGNTTIVSSGATAFSAGPTGNPTITITQAGLVTASNLAITGGTITIGSNSLIDSSGNATFIGVSTLNMKAYTNFETAGRFVSTVGGSGANSFGNQGVTISPGATATSYSRLLWRISNNVYGNNPTFVATITALSLNASSNTGQAFVGLGAPAVSGSSFGFNNSHIGFWIKKVSGIVTVASEQNDGTVGGNVGANIFEIVDNDIIELFIKVTSANVKYYYRKNGGTLTLGDTQTTRIPTGTDEYIMFATTNLDNATNFSFQIFCAAYEH